MEDERILERERRQIEQILQLDSEELQVEEVDDDESSEEGYDDMYSPNYYCFLVLIRNFFRFAALSSHFHFMFFKLK